MNRVVFVEEIKTYKNRTESDIVWDDQEEWESLVMRTQMKQKEGGGVSGRLPRGVPYSNLRETKHEICEVIP